MIDTNDAPLVEWSYAKEKRFKCLESKFRCSQAFMLVFLVFCFAIYLIFFGVDMAKYSGNLIQLFFVIVLDVLSLFFIGIGVRGVALEVMPLVFAFTVAIVFVAIGHCGTFLFRDRGLNASNLVLDSVLALVAIYHSVLLFRFKNMKPKDYEQKLQEKYRARPGDEEGSVLVFSEEPQIRKGEEKFETELKN